MILPRAHWRLAPVLLIMTTPPLSPRGHPRGDSKCMTRVVEPRPARGTPRAGLGSTTTPAPTESVDQWQEHWEWPFSGNDTCHQTIVQCICNSGRCRLTGGGGGYRKGYCSQHLRSITYYCRTILLFSASLGNLHGLKHPTPYGWSNVQDNLSFEKIVKYKTFPNFNFNSK